jgi:hypothetical protein
MWPVVCHCLLRQDAKEILDAIGGVVAVKVFILIARAMIPVVDHSANLRQDAK